MSIERSAFFTDARTPAARARSKRCAREGRLGGRRDPRRLPGTGQR